MDVPTTCDIARVAAQVTTALYDLVEREGQSTEPVTFRVRSLKAKEGGRGEPSQAAIEVHLGRGDSSQAAIEVNLALYDNALRARLLNRPLARGLAASLRLAYDFGLGGFPP